VKIFDKRMYELLTLALSGRGLLLGKLPFGICQVCHEDVVTGLRRETKPISGVLENEWASALGDSGSSDGRSQHCAAG